MTKLQVQGLDASPVFVLSPGDRALAETHQASTSGVLDLSPSAPIDSAARRIWGLPVVLVVGGLPAGTGLLLDRSSLSLCVDRQGGRVDVGRSLRSS